MSMGWSEIQQRLAVLREEHRDLDRAIDSLVENKTMDQLQLRRLKKRKLRLKDQITYWEDQLLPDINA